MKSDTIKIVGYSVGDSSVGIGSAHFEIDTGLCQLSKDDKEYIIKGMIRDMWELHDNGPIHYYFSDEYVEDITKDRHIIQGWRVLTWQDSEKILSEVK